MAWLHMALLTTHESSLPSPLAWELDTAGAQGVAGPFSRAGVCILKEKPRKVPDAA